MVAIMPWQPEKKKNAVSERFVLNLSFKVLILKYFSTFAASHCLCYLLHKTLYILKLGQIFGQSLA